MPAANVGADLAASNTFVSSPVIRNSEDLALFKVDPLNNGQNAGLGWTHVFTFRAPSMNFAWASTA